ncbi:MAG: restriction endonuclease subunit S [Nitrospirota bacterium]
MSNSQLSTFNSQLIPPGYKQTEVGVIPEDWNLRQLGDVVTFLDGRRRPVKDADRAKMRGPIPYYGASGIVDYVNDYLFDEDLILLGEDGENILSRNCRLAFRISGKAWVNNHAHVLKPNPDISIGFLTDYLESLNYERFNSGTAQPKLNKQTCFGIPIALPPTKAEQEAIAEALSDADTLIESLEQLLTKKHQLKQGAMQELLTGKKRLPGFSGKWEMRRLGECLISPPDYGINAPAVSYSDRLPTYIRITDISEDGRFAPDVLVSVAHPDAERYYLSAGDLVFARTGASVGKSYLCNPCDGPLVFAGFLIRVRPDSSRLIPAFLSNFVQTRSYWNWVKQMSMRSGQPGINGSEFARLLLPCPSVAEQAAITAILSDMDAEIAALEAKLAKARPLKQGMMQELLTGRVRLIN